MKARGALCLALLLAALGTRADDADGDDDVDDDLDLDDVDEGPGPAPPVEDFDLGIPEEDRRKMMASCWKHTINRVQLRKSELDAAIEQMVAARKESGMSSDQAMNTMLYGWMMACYMNIDGDGTRKVTPSDTQALESDIFSQRSDRPQQVNQASQRQWELLESTIKEQQQSTGGSSRSSPTGEGFSGQGGSTTYVLVVFAVIFGLGGLVVLKLVRADQSVQAEKDAKKAEKAEKKLSKKKTK